MARRSTAQESTPPVKVKAEKVKTEKVKTEKVKVKEEKTKGKQRAQAEEFEEEQQIPDQDENEEGQSQSTPADEEDLEESPRSKRRRTNVDGDSAPSGSFSQVKRENVKTHPRGADGYIPGSIVRIQLKNFVTYDFVEFQPGTHLNMIIGPNGTGKSSIACAIALGLNFPPDVLGRATEIGSFVKHGAEKGYIEIELKSPEGRDNLVIRRHLQTNSKTSSFTLNGSPATGAEIKYKMAELNVQVGNLCSFLPQDRVSEFAAMSPQKLLRETQRAAGDPNLTSWHDTLISAGKDIREIQQKIRDEELSLNQMKERNEGIEREVQRYKDRKKIEHTIGLLNVLIPVAEYRESRVKFVETKARQRKLHARVQALKEKNAPAHELLKKMEQIVKDLDKQRDNLKAATQSKFRQLTQKNKDSEDLQGESSKCIDQLIAMKDEEKRRLNQIKSLEVEIKKLKDDIARPPPEGLASEEELQDEARQITLERQDVVQARGDCDSQLKVIIDKIALANVNLARSRQELAKLDDADNQKLGSMARWDHTTFQAIQWVRENRHLFKMEVFETPFMRVTVKDKKYINAVEATLARGLKTFVAQCQEDCDTLNRYINDEEKFGKGRKITTWFKPNMPHLLAEPPMTREELAEQGFDGYAMDYVDFPEGLRWYLQTLNLHRTAIAYDGRKVDVGRVIDLVGRSGGATFYAGMLSHSVSRSRYGTKALSNVTRDVKPARNLTAPTIDLDAQRAIQESIRTCETDLALYDTEKRRINEEIDAIIIKDNAFKKRMAEVKRKKDMLTEESKRLQSAKAKYKAKSTALTKLKNAPPVDEKRKELKATLKVNAARRAKYAKEYTDLVHAIIFEQQKCTQAGLRYLQVLANKAALEELCNRKDKKYNETLVLFHEVDKEFKQVKAHSKAILEQSREILDASTDEVKADYEKMEEARIALDEATKKAKKEGRPPPPNDAGVDTRTVDELKADLETQKATLEMNLNTNAGIVEQYEKRKRDIEVLERTVEEKKQKEARLAKSIKAARDNWQPALQSLINRIGAKFSAAFDRIGCAGEIRISEDEDYEKWAVDILVKFRVSERLQLLTAHRQSGGERSLTTILYLLSLTEEARAPFSLVDEINQGMDQRAERAVHNSMVNVTCQNDSAQYFLITPKLLPDLEYDEKMKILCVNNGEWLPDVSEEGGLGNMMDMIDTFVATRQK